MLIQRTTLEEEEPAITWGGNHRTEVTSPYLEDLGELLTDQVADVPGEGQDDEDEVVHGPTDGEGLGVVVEAVAPGEVDHADLENKLNKSKWRVV